MPIPAGTKFHGVAPTVDTVDRGSSIANSNREAYPIEDFGGVLSVTVDIPPAQMLGLSNTPVEVVPGQGEGKAIVVVSAQAKLLFNSVPYNFTSGDLIGLTMSQSLNDFQFFDQDDNFNSSSDAWFLLNRWGNVFDNSSLVDNGPLVFGLHNTNPLGADVGDSTVQLKVYYKIVE